MTIYERVYEAILNIRRQINAESVIGEYIEDGPAVSPTALTDSVPLDIAEIELTAGDWDVTGFVAFIFNGVTGTLRQVAFSETSATVPVSGSGYASTAPMTAFSALESNAIPALRVSVDEPTTIYLVAESDFTVGTVSVLGRIQATRATNRVS